QLMDRVRADQPAAPGAAPTVAIPVCPRCRTALPAPAATACPGCGAVLAQPVDPAAEQDFKQALLRAAAPSSARTAAPRAEPVAHVAPVLAGVTQFHVALGTPVRPGSAELVYQPRLLGCAEVLFIDKRRNLEYRRTYRYLAAPPAPGEAANWHAAEPS